MARKQPESRRRSADLGRARRVVDEALAIAVGLTGQHRADALASVAEALAPLDLPQALALAEEMSDADSRWSLLHSIAPAIARQAPDRAIKLARSIRDSKTRASALRYVAEELAETEPERAITLVRAIRDRDARGSARREVAVALVRRHPHAALRLARGFRDAFDRSTALNDLAREGQCESAALRAICACAVRAALRIESPHDRAWELSAVAQSLARIDRERSSEVAIAALESARVEPHARARDCAVAEAVKALAKVDAPFAAEIARTVEDCWHRGLALAHVSAAVARTDPPFCRAMIDEALREASLAEDEDNRESIRDRVVDALIELDPKEAVEFTLGHGIGPSRAAEALARTDLCQALKAVDRAADSEARTDLRTAIVWAISRTDPDKALSVAEDIEDEAQRSPVVYDIVEALAPQDPTRALLIARRVDGDYSRVLALCRVAQALAGAA